MKKLGIIFGMTFLLSLGSFSIADAAEEVIIESGRCGYFGCYSETDGECLEAAAQFLEDCGY